MADAYTRSVEWLPSSSDVDRIGGKARGLSDLIRWGFDVPEGFVVPAGTPEGSPDVALASERLGVGPWAVRSSGVSEDSAQASFAGVHETVLGVRGREALHEAIRSCRASATAQRSTRYREQRGVEAAPLAVIVQRQVRPLAAGVAFSCDPVTGDEGTVVIEAVPGLGEALVSGHADPTRVRLDALGAVQSIEAPGEPCLDERQARDVGLACLQVAQRAARPVDIEWAIDGSRLWLLQWRPVTTHAARRVVWTNTNAAELLPDVARPLVESMLRKYVQALLAPLLSPFGLDVAGLGVFGLVRGRVYFNVNALLGWARAMPLAGRQDLSQFARGLGGDRERMQQAIALLRPQDLPTHRLSLWRMAKGSVGIALKLARHHRADASDELRAQKASNRALQAVDPKALHDVGLERHLGAAVTDIFGKTTDQTMFAAAWGMLGFALLQQLTRRWLDDETGALARRLLQGTRGLDTAAAGLALGALGAQARELQLGGALAGPWPEVKARLHGTALLPSIERFFAEHGHHARGEVDISIPRWRDEPEYVLKQVAFAAGAPPSKAMAEGERAAARAALLTATLRRLGPVQRAVLRAVLTRAERGAAARENNKSEALRRIAITRDAIVEAAQRLVARGALGSVDDVWYLRYDELQGALLGGAMPAVAERRAQYAEFEREQLPDVIVEGARLPAPPSSAPASAVLTGVAASAGIAEGPARVVLHADPEEGVRPGEILVAPHTDPGWTPYFLHAAAVVTDFGGMLSHGAVVAREYGLPCVVNVRGATVRIRTGQRIRVDGDAGRVELLEG